MKIMLDAGHSGKTNRSTVVPEYYESEVMYKLCGYLAEALKNYKDTQVFTTRSDINQQLSVYKRGRTAKDCDLFISLHSNASSSESTDRVTVYCPLDGRNNSARLGQDLATAVAKEMNVSKGVIKTRKGVAGEYYGVMRGAASVDCPVYFIIEHSFHTNTYATNWLLNDKNLHYLALAEAEIIADFYNLQPTFLPGDVNGNGVIDARDYVLARRIYMGTYTPTEDELKRADFDGDGKVTARDYILIKRAYLAKK